MLIQYTLKLLIPFLEFGARTQYKYGKRSVPKSQLAVSFSKFAGLISDSRMLWRLFGLLPIIQWMSSLERSPPANRRLLTIERLQALSMLGYYPLEHLYYFGAHKIYPISAQRLSKLALWSTRFWAAYVVLQFLHIKEDMDALSERAARLKQARRAQLAGKAAESANEIAEKAGAREELSHEYESIKKRKLAIIQDFIINLAYFPQTIHWSLEKGAFSNDIWTTIFGFVAAVASFKRGYETA
ncbi:hypothetical protein FRC03_008155 [Tulasnella sp. 419]|nr:hypothetical protein FRC03_008155 [Tulasnella sp. 419]